MTKHITLCFILMLLLFISSALCIGYNDGYGYKDPGRGYFDALAIQTDYPRRDGGRYSTYGTGYGYYGALSVIYPGRIRRL